MPRQPKSTKTLDIGVKHAGLATFVFLGKVISILAGALMLIIVARILGPTQYGIYVVALAVASFISAFGSINAGVYFNKKLPQLSSEKNMSAAGTFIGDSLLFFIIVSLILTIVGALLSTSISLVLFSSPSYSFYILLAVTSIFWTIAYGVYSTALVGVGTGTEVAVSTMLYLVLQAITSITLVLLGFGVTGAIIGYLTGFAVATVVSLYYLNRHVPIHFSLRGIRQRLHEILSFSVPLTISGIVVGLSNNFAVILMGLLLIPAGLIGQYGVALKVGTVIDTATGAISVVLVPLFATAIYSKQTISKIGNLYRASLFYGLLFAAPMVVFASVLSKNIIVTVFTASYSSAVLYMPIISIGLLISLVGGYASYVLISFGKVRKVMKYSVYVTIVQFAAMVLLGLEFRVIGIIVGYLYIGSIISAYLYIHELHVSGVRFQPGPILRVVMSNFILAIAFLPLLLLTIRPLYVLIIGVVEALIVYPFLLAKTRTVSKDDIMVLSKVSKQVPVLGSTLGALVSYTAFFI